MSQTLRPRVQTQMKATPPAERLWYVVDAKGKVVGRLATQVAKVLMGKHRPTYAPQVDNGDFVVVLNAADARLTGKKMDKKVYFRNTGYPGGLRITPVRELLAHHPEQVMEKAIRRMLPKTRLGEQMFKKLKVYADAKHPHAERPLTALEI